MKDRFHIAVTGASGYIGRHTVMEAVNRGHHVTAIARNLGHVDPAWRENPQISGVELNLSARGAYARLTSALKGVDAVIHTAAAMSGDDREHEENTLRPTRALLKAMISRPGGAPRLVLVSSLTVYDTDVLTEGAMIDETKPIVVDTKSRDAYCRSKLVQEAMALEVAAMHDLELRIMRVGAVFGPGRLWNGHIGPAFGPFVVQLEKYGQVPVSYVAHCAEALVLAARHPVEFEDRPGEPGLGHVEIINVLDDDLPNRKRYLTALRRSGWPSFVLPGSWRPLAVAASAISSIAPNLSQQMPGLLRPSIIHSRMKPLTYSNKRLRKRLVLQPLLSFEEAMARSVTRQLEGNEYACAS